MFTVVMAMLRYKVSENNTTLNDNIVNSLTIIYHIEDYYNKQISNIPKKTKIHQNPSNLSLKFYWEILRKKNSISFKKI